MRLQTFDTSSFSVSVGYILLTAVVIKLARLILLQVVKSKYYQKLWLEFLATFELIATCFELGIGKFIKLQLQFVRAYQNPMHNIGFFVFQ
jgi:hypothetical protein